MTPDDALLSLSAIETAVYDPPRLGHECHEVVRSGLWWQFSEWICGHCGGVWKKPRLEHQLCPARPAPDPDWQACLFAADLCEDVLQDEAMGAWWRWLHVEQKVPEFMVDEWHWWGNVWPEESVVGNERRDMLRGDGRWNNSYTTRRAAYLDLCRVKCEEWRQEHETRKELMV